MVSLFLLLGCNLSYIVDLFASLHEFTSASVHITKARIIGACAVKTLWRHLKVEVNFCYSPVGRISCSLTFHWHPVKNLCIHSYPKSYLSLRCRSRGTTLDAWATEKKVQRQTSTKTSTRTRFKSKLLFHRNTKETELIKHDQMMKAKRYVQCCKWSLTGIDPQTRLQMILHVDRKWSCRKARNDMAFDLPDFYFFSIFLFIYFHQLNYELDTHKEKIFWQ